MCGRHAAVQLEPPEAAPPPGQRSGGFLSACEGSWAALRQTAKSITHSWWCYSNHVTSTPATLAKNSSHLF
jgi:hypothetical protein